MFISLLSRFDKLFVNLNFYWSRNQFHILFRRWNKLSTIVNYYFLPATWFACFHLYNFCTCIKQLYRFCLFKWLHLSYKLLRYITIAVFSNHVHAFSFCLFSNTWISAKTRPILPLLTDLLLCTLECKMFCLINVILIVLQ